MPPRILSHSGCWTCRIRHKKCDEARPECNECKSRTITCHGYHEKPDFMKDPELLRSEISRIKLIVKENLRHKKRLQHRTTANPGAQCGFESKADGTDILAPKAAGTSPWIAGASKETVFREAELTMYYLDLIFPILFPYCQWNPVDGGRGWLFWLLSQDAPLRQAALSLAALHQRAQRASCPFGMKTDETELLEYHTSALSGLRQTLQYTNEMSLINDIGQLTHLMACGCSLISFEVCQGKSEQWQAHLQALVSVARHLVPKDIACIATRKGCSQSSTAHGILMDEHKSSLELGRMHALGFFVAQVLWYELLACASIGTEPRMPYRIWLDADCINMVNLMGCEHWVLEVIGDIASLDAMTAQLHDEQIFETITGCEHELRRGIDAVKAKQAAHQPRSNSFSELDCQRRQTRTCYVTLAFATTARLLLNIIKPAEASPEHCVGECSNTIVDQLIVILNQAAQIMSLRGLVWPICIAGSLANTAQQEQIGEIMKVVASSGDTSFGNCDSVMGVLKYCWRNETSGGTNAKPWRTAMAAMGHCVLLI